MHTLRNVFGIAVGFAMVAAFALALIVLVLNMASSQIPTLQESISELRCWAGIPSPISKCVADELEALERERQRLESLIAGQSFVFSSGDKLKDGVNLVVGTLYENAALNEGVLRSFCWAIVDHGGLDPRVGLAVMHGDGSIKDVSVSDADLALLGLNDAEVVYARMACPFPDIVK